MKTNINLRKIFSRLLPVVLIAGLVGIMSSCYAPSPLYGTWSDSYGSKISFMADGTFNATTTINNHSELSEGTYSVLKNVIVFTRSSGTVMTTEWDIRGNLLYLDWLDEMGNSKQLNLMKISD
ncbi:MAG: hypothetical protein J6W60_08410 [Treponema sp.]|nr:hypothetical protein [Treponema sp.]MBP5752863.1 hypothetical protein [Treponema sp.]